MVRLFVLVLMASMTGCAVFDDGKVPKTTLSPYEDNDFPKPTIAYSSTALGGVFSVKTHPEALQSIIEGELFSVLDSSEYFSRIAKRDEGADIRIDVTMTDIGSSVAMIPALITGMSLYTIPSWVTNHFNLVAKVERKDRLKKEYTLTDSVLLVQWLPMMFLFPVKNFSVIPDLRKNMYKKVLADMKNDGFFSSHKETVSLVR
jgi:hypothetical protein